MVASYWSTRVSMVASYWLVSWFITSLGDLQPTFIGVMQKGLRKKMKAWLKGEGECTGWCRAGVERLRPLEAAGLLKEQRRSMARLCGLSPMDIAVSLSTVLVTFLLHHWAASSWLPKAWRLTRPQGTMRSQFRWAPSQYNVANGVKWGPYIWMATGVIPLDPL